jgi:MFS family permease
MGTYRFIFLLAAIPGSNALLLIWFGIKEKTAETLRGPSSKQIFPWTFWVFTIGTSIAMLTKINDSLFLLRAHDTGIPLSLIPILFAGFTLLYAVASYPIGIWSDRVGKAPLIAVGWLVLAVVELIFAFHPGITAALVLFAFYGLFYALTEGSGRAIIADLVPKSAHGSAYAIFYTLTGISVIVGGFGLGKIWDNISPSLAFQISAAGSFLGFIILAMLWRRRPGVQRA